MTESDGFTTVHPPLDGGPGLTEARGRLADAPHHSDAELIEACGVILAMSDDAEERAEARAMLARLEVAA